jgi:hypothetical protein
LRLSPRADLASSGGCLQLDDQPLPDEGVMIEVAQVLPAASGYTAFLAEQDGLSIGVSDDKLSVGQASEVLNSVHYDPAAMRWWRMRPDRERTPPMFVAEFSPDGFSWTKLGESTDVPTLIRIKIDVGTQDVEADPGVAEIDNLNSCPF